MTASAAAHEAHLDAEQLAGDLAEELAQACSCWHLDCGAPEPAQPVPFCPVHGDVVPLDPPPSPEDEETFPPDPEGAAA